MLQQPNSLSLGPLFLPSSTEQNTFPSSTHDPERDPGDSGPRPCGPIQPTPLLWAQASGHPWPPPWLLEVDPQQIDPNEMYFGSHPSLQKFKFLSSISNNSQGFYISHSCLWPVFGFLALQDILPCRAWCLSCIHAQPRQELSLLHAHTLTHNRLILSCLCVG